MYIFLLRSSVLYALSRPEIFAYHLSVSMAAAPPMDACTLPKEGKIKEDKYVLCAIPLMSILFTFCLLNRWIILKMHSTSEKEPHKQTKRYCLLMMKGMTWKLKDMHYILQFLQYKILATGCFRILCSCLWSGDSSSAESTDEASQLTDSQHRRYSTLTTPLQVRSAKVKWVVCHYQLYDSLFLSCTVLLWQCKQY